MTTLLEQTLAVGQGTAGTRVADAMITCPKTHGPRSSIDEIRALFDDDHVHIALIVAAGGRLISTIERSDLAAATAYSGPVAGLGTLAGRTVGPSSHLEVAAAALVREGRRRLAVVDHRGRLLGLLCQKWGGRGYCTDEGVRSRARDVHGPNQHVGAGRCP